MTRPPRNRELERLVIDVLRAAEDDPASRQGAWQVYADWLLGLGEPVGEWLAASLRAEDAGEAAAPIRAQLGDIERAARFRLVDLELADLSEVPELTRIADFTWERGFITQAVFRCAAFRAWDSQLLRHTPDRFLEVVLRSPSACALHHLELDHYDFVAEGSSHVDFGELLASFEEDLPLRSLKLGGPEGALRIDPGCFARLPELRELSLRPWEPPRPTQQSYQPTWRVPAQVHPRRVDWIERRVDFASLLRTDLHEQLPRLEVLELRRPEQSDALVAALLDSRLLEGLRKLRLAYLGSEGFGRMLEAKSQLADLDVELIELGRLDDGHRQIARSLGWLPKA